jgi:hypothetical protein
MGDHDGRPAFLCFVQCFLYKLKNLWRHELQFGQVYRGIMSLSFYTAHFQHEGISAFAPWTFTWNSWGPLLS